MLLGTTGTRLEKEATMEVAEREIPPMPAAQLGNLDSGVNKDINGF
jgi:hypothetical protein